MKAATVITRILPDTDVPLAGGPLSAPDVLTCEWDRDLYSAGMQPGLPATFRIGISLLALTAIAVSVLLFAVAPVVGVRLDPAVFGLSAAAALPWAWWAIRDDNGPSWRVAGLVLGPLVLLGIVLWVDETAVMGSDPAYYLATIPALLLVLLYAAFAPVRMAVGVTVAALCAFVLPLLLGWAVGRLDVAAIGVVLWPVGLALCAVAGYAVRLSYITNRRLLQAREALARQEAADQRRRIAQDVHDVVAHTLAITMLHITAARMAVRRSSPLEAEEALEEAERHGRASLSDIRRIVRLLRSEDGSAVDAAQPGLADIEGLTASYRAAGLPVEMTSAIDGRHVSPASELAIFRILQEALANAARHGSGPATVDLRMHDDEIVLSVTNPVRQPPTRSSLGSGLLGMRERVMAAGGTVEAGPRNGRWIVRASVPTGAPA
jgi:signal transduction histidine kinase